MLWLKRNILLVVSVVGALALLGVAIAYLLGEYSVYNSYDESIKQLKAGIKTLSEYDPTPSEANIAIIKGNAVVLKKFMDEAEGLFVGHTNAGQNSGQFKVQLDKTIAELTREATNSGIGLPPRYRFTFGELQAQANIPVTLIPDLAVQLEEVRALAQVLIESRISSLQTLRRTPVRGEPTSSNPEYITERQVVTNHYGIVAPYEVSFKSFTPELATVLNKLATHRYFLVVRKIEVQTGEGTGPAPPPKPSDDMGMTPTGFAPGVGALQAGGSGTGVRAVAAPAQAGTGKGGKGGVAGPRSNLVKQLDEKPLLVTMRIDIIKPYKGPKPTLMAVPPGAGPGGNPATAGAGNPAPDASGPPVPPTGTNPKKSKTRDPDNDSQ